MTDTLEVVVPSFMDLSAVERHDSAPRARTLGRVLMFDNGRLNPVFGQYAVIFDVVRERLSERFTDVEFIELMRRPSTLNDSELVELAQFVCGQEVDAVIIGLCDFGVSQSSTLLAGMLERAGVPTVLICQGAGVQQVVNTSAALGQTIAYVEIRSPWTASAEAMRLDMDAVTHELIAALTTSPPAPLASPSPAWSPAGLVSLHGTDPGVEYTEQLQALGLGDGLPMVAPTPVAVDLMVAASGMEASAKVWPALFSRNEPVTVRDVATVAVAAGCRPEMMWAVLSAYKAMAAAEFRLSSTAVTTHPGGYFVLVSGPRAVECGIASGPGCLGPGYVANATIGRAVALGPRIFLGAIQARADLTQQGSPARYSFCCAENVAESPWPSLAETVTGDPTATTVTVLKCEGGRNVMDHASKDATTLLDSIAGNMTSISSNNAYIPQAQTTVIMNPLHARIAADAGYSREDVQRYFYETARVPRLAVSGRGSLPRWPTWFKHLERVPIALGAEDITIAVAGGPGMHSQVMIPWGHSRGVTVRV